MLEMNSPELSTTGTEGPRGGEFGVGFFFILFSIIISSILDFKKLLNETSY
jgi:hypothetical protein